MRELLVLILSNYFLSIKYMRLKYKYIWSNMKKRRVIFCALQMKKSGGRGTQMQKITGGVGNSIMVLGYGVFNRYKQDNSHFIYNIDRIYLLRNNKILGGEMVTWGLLFRRRRRFTVKVIT